MLSQIISDQLLKDRAAEEPRNYLGASLIGKECMREIWYEHNHHPAALFAAKQLLTFEIGKAVEGQIKELLYGNKSWRLYPPQYNSEDNNLRGTPDLIYYGENLSADDRLWDKKTVVVYEIKTANNASFNQFKKHGLRKWREQYYAQIQVYMGMSEISKGILLCINKDNSEIHEEEAEFDDLYYKMLLTKARTIKDATEPPPRISSTPLHPSCKMCQHKEICFNER